jgi:hypothetical protein
VSGAGAGASTQLGYPFDPIPKWVGQRWEQGELSDECRDVLLVLFARANTAALAARGETPRLRIESLATGAGRPTDKKSLESLKRLLRRYRQDGLLEFRTEGTGGRTVHVFRLFPDGPRPSALVPGNRNQSVPPREVREVERESDVTAVRADGHSASREPRDGEWFPPNGSAIPPSEAAAKPHQQTESGYQPNAPVPPSSDVREKANPCSEEAVKEKPSVRRESAQDFLAHPLAPDVEMYVQKARRERERAFLDELVRTFDACLVEDRS